MTQQAAAETLSLPMYPNLTEDQIELVARRVLDALGALVGAELSANSLADPSRAVTAR